MNPLIAGGGIAGTVKLVLLLTEPSVLITVIGPVVAPIGTNTVMLVSVGVPPIGDDVPLKRTSVADRRFVPLIVTIVLGVPLTGVNPEIVGRPTTRVKLVALVTVPPFVVIEIGPLVAPAGKEAKASVDELIP